MSLHMQVQQVIDIVKNVTSSGKEGGIGGTPFLITGDFNARPDENAVGSSLVC